MLVKVSDRLYVNPKSIQGIQIYPSYNMYNKDVKEEIELYLGVLVINITREEMNMIVENVV